MGLIHPASPSWAYCSHNIPAPPAATTVGTQCTPGGSNSDGTAAALLSALSHDAEYLRLSFTLDTSQSPSGVDADIMASILIDPAGGTSWSTLIPNLILGGLSQVGTVGAGTTGSSCMFDFPLWIPAGASLGIQARCASSGAIPLLRTVAFAYGGNANPASWWCGQRITDIGTSPSTSNGTLHTAGNSGSFSSWTDFGSTLAADCGALQFAVGGEGDATWGAGGTSTVQYQFEFGVGGVQVGGPIFKEVTTSEAGWSLMPGLIFKRLAAGTQLQARGTCSGTAQGMGVAAYAVH
jgi:hypothetical protein